MRCWARKQNIASRDETSYQAKILAQAPKLEADFSRAKGVLSEAKAKGEARFVQNPDHWGPQRKHGRPALVPEANGGGGAGACEGSEPATKKAKAETEGPA
jgi:hypothetical protein